MNQVDSGNSSFDRFEPRRPRQTDIGAGSRFWLSAPIRIRVERDGRKKVYLSLSQVGLEVAALN